MEETCGLDTHVTNSKDLCVRVRLDVGGTLFSTSLTTLTKVKGRKGLQCNQLQGVSLKQCLEEGGKQHKLVAVFVSNRNSKMMAQYSLTEIPQCFGLF